jgi:phytanoyl-CoA hydroxylase
MERTQEGLWFDETVEEYPPELYRYSALAQGVDGFDAVADKEIELFHEQGYLVVQDAFTPDEVGSALEGLLDLVEGRNPEFRGIQFEAKARDALAALPLERKQDAVRKFWHFIDYDARLKALSEHPKLMAVLSRLIGGVPELFQDMALFKPPLIGREKPWHQDHAYFNMPLGTTIVGVWIALDEATLENGCMQVIPGSHLKGPVVHFKRRDWQICDSHVAAGSSVAVPLEPGGCLLFHGLLHHGTPANWSPKRRRAVQFHYKPSAVGWTTEEERLSIFGSEGKDVAC